MQKPPRPTLRESTETMVLNIGRELAEIEQAIDRFRSLLKNPAPSARIGQLPIR